MSVFLARSPVGIALVLALTFTNSIFAEPLQSVVVNSSQLPSQVTDPGTAASYTSIPSSGAAPPRPIPQPPPVNNPGTGASYVVLPEVTNPGTGAGLDLLNVSTAIHPSAVVYPGTGVSYVTAGSPVVAPPIINPGTGVSYIVIPSTAVNAAAGAAPYLSNTSSIFNPSTVINPGTGVGYFISVPGTLAPQVVNPGTGVSYVPITSGIGVAIPAISAVNPGVGVAGTPALSQPLPAAAGINPFNFTYLASHLRDCDREFHFSAKVSESDLAKHSPFCAGRTEAEGGVLPDPPGNKNGNHRLCERYDISQFPEVLRLAVRNEDQSIEYCTATLIAYDWALTAAHCFVGDDPTSAYTSSTGVTSTRDLVWRPGNSNARFVSAVVSALNTVFLDDVGRNRTAQEVVVYGKYGGQNSKPTQYLDDLALINLSSPYLSRDVEPASLAQDSDFDKETAVGGYGFTNADGASIGNFNLGWPQIVQRIGGELKFSPTTTSSSFCQGDSGGPIYAHRLRGCKVYDIVPEARPHVIEGVVSYNHPGASDTDAQTTAQVASSECVNGGEMVAQDLTYGARRNWICRITGNTASGCQGQTQVVNVTSP
jgi:hypothetical protein